MFPTLGSRAQRRRLPYGMDWSPVQGTQLLKLIGSTVVTSTPLIDMSQTWNATASVFTGLKLNVMRAGYAATSNLFDFQLDGTTVVKYQAGAGEGGGLVLTAASPHGQVMFITPRESGNGSPAILSGGLTLDGPIRPGNNNIIALAGLYGSNTNRTLWFSSNAPTTFQIYNTTDAEGSVSPTNYERGAFDWTTTSNTLTVGVQTGGSGVARDMNLSVPTTKTVYLNNNTNFGWGSAPDAGFKYNSLSDSSYIGVYIGADTRWALSVSGPSLGPSARVVWGSSGFGSAEFDAGLGRNATGVVEVNSGTNGTFRDLVARNLIAAAGTTLSTSSTTAFVWLTSMAGVPTGTPATASYTGSIPLVVDTTNTRLYGYFSGAWNNMSGGAGVAPGGSSTEVQYRSNATTFGGMGGSAWDNTNRSLTITGTTVVTSNPVISLTQTWNASAVVFDGFKLNVTNTTSASTSVLMNLQAGGTTVFSVSPAGAIGPRILENEVALADTTTVALDAALGNTFKLSATANRTIGTPTNKPASGQVQKIVIAHEAVTAPRTLSFTTGAAGQFRFGTDITAITATGTGLVDYIGCIYNDADDRWDIISYVKGF